MKQFSCLLMILGLYACTGRPDHTPESGRAGTVQPPPPAAEAADTLPLIPERAVQAAYRASRSVHSHHSMLKNEFPFDSWLTRMANQDSIQHLSAYVDSLMRRPSRTADSAALSEEWRLAYFLNYGWYEMGMDKTAISRYYRSGTNKFRLRGTDLLNIFRASERWSARLIGEEALVIQYGYVYLNGNQTSWEYYHLYLFVK